MTEETIKKTIETLRTGICSHISSCDSEVLRLGGKMHTALYTRNGIKDEASMEYEAYDALYNKYYNLIASLKNHRDECIEQLFINAIDTFMELKDKE